jgi:hypothetical protein
LLKLPRTINLFVVVSVASSIRLAVLPDHIHQWIKAFIFPVVMHLWTQPASSMPDSMVWSSGVMFPSEISVIQLSWFVRWVKLPEDSGLGPPP